MTLDVQKRAATGRKQPHRTFGYSLGIALVLTALTWLIYDGMKHTQSTSSSDEAYRYSLDQSLDHSVNYFKNSYFTDTTLPQANAYIRELTNTIDTNFRYTYQSNHKTNLSYTYVVTAHVIAANPAKDAKQTVWDETYQIVPVVTKNELTDTVRITANAALPFQEYSRRVAQINAGLGLALEANVQLTFSVTLTGNYDGKPISDSQTMTVAIPLSDSVYSITDTYKKRDGGTIQSESQPENSMWWQAYRPQLIIVTAILLLIVIVCWLRPWSGKQFGRSPYQRERAKIYRYHDGLIIRTQHTINVEDREHIPVSSFEDLLNLSEELRVPIIANDLGIEASRFVVIQDRTVYSYTIGKVANESYKVS